MIIQLPTSTIAKLKSTSKVNEYLTDEADHDHLHHRIPTVVNRPETVDVLHHQPRVVFSKTQHLMVTKVGITIEIKVHLRLGAEATVAIMATIVIVNQQVRSQAHPVPMTFALLVEKVVANVLLHTHPNQMIPTRNVTALTKLIDHAQPKGRVLMTTNTTIDQRVQELGRKSITANTTSPVALVSIRISNRLRQRIVLPTRISQIIIATERLIIKTPEVLIAPI